MFGRLALASLRSPKPFRFPRPPTTTTPYSTPRRAKANQFDDGPSKRGKDEDQIERWKYLSNVKPRPDRNARNLVPEEERDEHNTFRRGFSLPKRGAPTLFKMIYQPIYDIIAFSQVTWDTTTRYTRLGFTLLHVCGIIVSLTLGAQLGEYSFMEVTDQFHIAYEEYMFHMAQLIWVRKAIKYCEAVIDARPFGVPDAPLLEEAIQLEQKRYQYEGSHIDIEKKILARALFAREKERREEELKGLTKEQRDQVEFFMKNRAKAMKTAQPLTSVDPKYAIKVMERQKQLKNMSIEFKTMELSEKQDKVRSILEEQSSESNFKQKYIYSNVNKHRTDLEQKKAAKDG